MPRGSRSLDSLTAVQKAFALLSAMLEEDGPATLADLAERTQIPKPSIHRFMLQLEEVGVVMKIPDSKSYTVSASVLDLAIKLLKASTKRPMVREVMRSLVESVQESCNLGVRTGAEIIYIERVECDWPLRSHYQAGTTVPMHCTASGKLWLAELDSDQRRKLIYSLDLKSYTNRTITDPEALMAECDKIQSAGISLNVEEYNRGVIGIAVPVRRRDGSLIAALAIHAPAFRLTINEALKKEPEMRHTAEILSETIMSQNS